MSSLFNFWRKPSATQAADVVQRHFHPVDAESLSITQRSFPHRVRADLQRAIDQIEDLSEKVTYVCGLHREYSHEGIGLKDCMFRGGHSPTICIPPEFEEIDIGSDEPVRCMKAGLWMIEEDGQHVALLVGPAERHGWTTGLRVEIAVENTPQGTQLARRIFQRLERAVEEAGSYRGKVLSLEQSEHHYSGESTGIAVQQLNPVVRDDVILPQRTLELLERNVVRFVEQRTKLADRGLSTRKGLLFYGPPGTGKTHTLHYLAGALPGHTTLIITAEQVALLDEYMTLARLLQPSIVILEDVDLIARERTQMNGGCEEILLNKLLNQMDGLKESADILFILTTNRPEMLEPALASRPGRIDQAIEFPLPDEDGRRQLVRLYAADVRLGDDLLAEVVQKTGGVSAAFIKELMRRSVQFQLERGSDALNAEDVDQALDEMLVRGGSLNRILLGATAHSAETCS